MSFFLPPQEKKHSGVVLRDFIGLTVFCFFLINAVQFGYIYSTDLGDGQGFVRCVNPPQTCIFTELPWFGVDRLSRPR